MKYIRHKDLGFVLFERTIAHADMARWLKIEQEEILSAGSVGVDESNLTYCYGWSQTLNKHSLKEDTELLQHQLEQT